jgi:hypothetical protein
VNRAVPVLLLALVASPAITAAAEPQGASFGARDPAAIACPLFVDMATRAPAGTERQFYDWAQGYFAGRATSGTGRRLPADGPGRAENFQALVDFCRKNPDARFEAAVTALWSSAP